MAFLNKIKVTITTGRDAGAGTDASVYLGLAGREFRCDTSADDFERGSTRDYIFGDDANIQRPHDNDPRKPPLDIADVNLFPAYIRFSQAGGSSWLLADAKVYVENETAPRFETPISNNPIWLGDASGCIYYFRKPKAVPRGG
jgi:hypothetical protein